MRPKNVEFIHQRSQEGVGPTDGSNFDDVVEEDVSNEGGQQGLL